MWRRRLDGSGKGSMARRSAEPCCQNGQKGRELFKIGERERREGRRKPVRRKRKRKV